MEDRTQPSDMMVRRILVLDNHNSVPATMLHYRDDDVLLMVRNHHEQHDYHRLKRTGKLTFFFVAKLEFVTDFNERNGWIGKLDLKILCI